ncbi:hypothetical protein L1887_23107 [Cichorium endivia]|nr:hypothetical protein L1887_23107 [Cichorium endivia]
MAGRRKELGFLERTGVVSLREQLARTAPRNVRLKAHTYVELREDSKKVIFFCVLCLAPCYSDSVLHDHLCGHLHKQMYEAAKATLLKQNPFTTVCFSFISQKKTITRYPQTVQIRGKKVV